jgi:hypothetical protein
MKNNRQLTFPKGVMLASSLLMMVSTSSMAVVWPQDESAYRSSQRHPQWIEPPKPAAPPAAAPQSTLPPVTNGYYPAPQPVYPSYRGYPSYGSTYPNYYGPSRNYPHYGAPYGPQHGAVPPPPPYWYRGRPNRNRFWDDMPFFGDDNNGFPNFNDWDMPDFDMPSFDFPSFNW